MSLEMFDKAVPRNVPADPPPYRRGLVVPARTPVVTYSLIAINVLVFVAMLMRGVPLTDPSGEALLSWGADFGPATLHGEPWRLVTCMFLHFGILHLGMNMYVLYQMGPATERFFGNVRYFVLFMVAGLCASLASVVVHPDSVGAGASGAIFGVYGGLMAFMYSHRDRIHADARRGLIRSAATFLGINLIYGFTAHIDLTAHIAGLFFGFAAGILLAPRQGQDAVESERVE